KRGTCVRSPAHASGLSIRLALLLIASLLLIGCRPPPPPVATTPTAKESKQTDESAIAMKQALDALRKLAEGTDVQPIQRTIFYLNQWLATYPPAKAPWEEDKLLSTVPPALARTPGLDRLHQLQFAFNERDLLHILKLDDIAFLQQNLWLHDIAARARREPSPQALKPWLKEIETSVGLPEAEQLATAERLFDWTVRNLQLDVLPPVPKAPEVTVGEGANAIDPAMQA